MSILVPVGAGSSSGPTFEVPPASTPEGTTVQDLVIPMSDGIRLFADLVHPEPLEPRPTILTVTGYNKMAVGAVGGFFAEHGYNVLVVDDRGTGSSEGFWDAWGERIHRDYVEILDWLVEQPWSDGTVGTTGMSYMGITALFLAGTGHPSVRAVWADVPMADAYRDVVFHGGSLNAAFMPFWLSLVGSLGLLPPSWMGDDPAGAILLLVQHAQGLADFQAQALGSFASGGELAYDGPFYRIRSPETYAPLITVPVAYTGGWFDIFQRGETRLHGALSQLGSEEKKWFMSPIYHTGGPSHWGELGIGSSSAVQLAWFDRWLKGVPNGIERIPSINLFTMGADRWQHPETWPPEGTRWTPFHLTGQPSGSATSLSDGGLRSASPGADGGDLLPHLPLVGVCSRSLVQWSAGLIGMGTPCETDNSLTELLSLTYTTDPFTQDLEVTGPLSLILWATIDRPEATLAAWVTDVAPDGTSLPITGGWLNASHRALDEERTVRDENGEPVIPFHPFTREAQQPVEVGVPTEYAIEIFGTSHVFRAGHRMRVVVSSSDAHAVPSVPAAVDALLGTTTVHHGERYASRLLVPTRAPLTLEDESESAPQVDATETAEEPRVLGTAIERAVSPATDGDGLPLTGSGVLPALVAASLALIMLGMALMRIRRAAAAG